MGLIGKCCCLSMLLSKLLCLACTFGPLIFMYLLYIFYIKPWGEQQVKDLTNGVSLTSAAVNCSGCVVGVNTQFPTTTTGVLHFMDTNGGTASTVMVGTSIVATIAAIFTGTAVGGAAADLGSSGSMGSGVYEMMGIIEQAQFVGLLGQLATSGVPTFFQQFTKDLSWVNFNIAKLSNSDPAPTRKLLNLLEAQHQQTGVERYATMVGVLPEDLFYYTLLAIAVVFGAVLILYIVGSLVMSGCAKKGENPWRGYFRKVIWAYILVLLLSLYIVSMTGSYRAYYTFNKGTSGAGSAVVVILAALIGVTLVCGVVIIATHPSEWSDLGTYEHEQRPFNAKYGPYYEEFNADNRYFFVPKAILSVATGIIVGVVQNPSWQLGLLIGANLLFLLALIIREPFLLRFLFYIGVLSTFLKIALLILMAVMLRDDVFPQKVRDNVAYVIVGVNLAVFALLVIRQLYITIRKIIMSRAAKKKNPDQRADFTNNDSSPTRTPHSPQPKSNFHDMEQGQAQKSIPVREPMYAQKNLQTAGDNQSNLNAGSSNFGSHNPNSIPPRNPAIPSSQAASANTRSASSPPNQPNASQENGFVVAPNSKSVAGRQVDEMKYTPDQRISSADPRTDRLKSSPIVQKSAPQQAMFQTSAPPSGTQSQANAALATGAAGLAGAALLAAAAKSKPPPHFDDKEYDLDSELSLHENEANDFKAQMPYTADKFQHRNSGDSYGSSQSFGSFGGRANRPGSHLSDSMSLYSSHDASNDSFSHPGRGSIPNQGQTTHNSSFGSDSYRYDANSPFSAPFRAHDNTNNSFQSYQSAHFSDNSMTQGRPVAANDSFVSLPYSEGSSMAGQSGIFDSLAAKYLIGMDKDDEVGQLTRSSSAVPILERKPTKPLPLTRSCSVGDNLKNDLVEKKQAYKPKRHSDSDLVCAVDDAKRQSVYLRYIANGQAHSFMDSEDEIDL
ncbi:hypothetical protein AeRB84_006422 [Aphanomyces euteiches]|nr:hypothetical protein AeRB84_006422 [Aphanomyces euteiches]